MVQQRGLEMVPRDAYMRARKHMLPEMTPAVNRALAAASWLASQAGAQEVEPIYLLHGLLREEEGRASLLADAAGFDRKAYQPLCPPCPAEPDSSATVLPLHANTRAAFSLAVGLAPEVCGDFTVASEAILLGLLRCDEVVRRFAEGLGLRMEVLETDLQRHQGPPIQLEEPLHLAETTEQMDLGRLIDACANRAREGLRVVEDYCRFTLEDPFLCGELKRLRHDLTSALRDLPAGPLLQARETQYDVGTSLSTAAEQKRYTLVDVAQANLKRLQEALRSLEEFGKLPLLGGGPRLGATLEQLRYRTYTLERAIVLGTSARERLAGVRLCVLVAGAHCTRSLKWTIEQAVAGGAQMIQLREKGLTDRQLLERAAEVRQWTRELGVLLILNDRPDLARLVQADGVHVGQDDLPVKEVRRVLGPEALIGVSTHNLEDVSRAILDGASYLGVGPAFPTRTKKMDAYPGPDFIRQALAATTLPAFVIGGVNLGTVVQAAALGARRLAVSQAILTAEDPRTVARDLLAALPEK